MGMDGTGALILAVIVGVVVLNIPDDLLTGQILGLVAAITTFVVAVK